MILKKILLRTKRESLRVLQTYSIRISNILYLAGAQAASRIILCRSVGMLGDSYKSNFSALKALIQSYIIRFEKNVNSEVKNKEIYIVCDYLKVGDYESHPIAYFGVAGYLAKVDLNTDIKFIVSLESKTISKDFSWDDSNQYIGVVKQRFLSITDGFNFQNLSLSVWQNCSIMDLFKSINLIVSRRPIAVIFFTGKSNESVLFRFIANQFTKVVCLPTQCNYGYDNQLKIAVSSIPVQNIRINSIDPVDEKKLVNLRIPRILKEEINQKKLVRNTIDSRLNYKIVSALTGNRLISIFESYNINQINFIKKFLEGVNGVWYLIGCDLNTINPFTRNLLRELVDQKKIIIMPAINHFSDFLEDAHIYIQPPGATGGGHGADIARNLMIPVVCDDRNDAFGLQPEGFVAKTDSLLSVLSIAECLLGSDEARQLYFTQYLRIRNSALEDAERLMNVLKGDGKVRLP